MRPARAGHPRAVSADGFERAKDSEPEASGRSHGPRSVRCHWSHRALTGAAQTRVPFERPGEVVLEVRAVETPTCCPRVSLAKALHVRSRVGVCEVFLDDQFQVAIRHHKIHVGRERYVRFPWVINGDRHCIDLHRGWRTSGGNHPESDGQPAGLLDGNARPQQGSYLVDVLRARGSASICRGQARPRTHPTNVEVAINNLRGHDPLPSAHGAMGFHHPPLHDTEPPGDKYRLRLPATAHA